MNHGNIVLVWEIVPSLCVTLISTALIASCWVYRYVCITEGKGGKNEDGIITLVAVYVTVVMAVSALFSFLLVFSVYLTPH